MSVEIRLVNGSVIALVDALEPAFYGPGLEELAVELNLPITYKKEAPMRVCTSCGEYPQCSDMTQGLCATCWGQYCGAAIRDTPAEANRAWCDFVHRGIVPAYEQTDNDQLQTRLLREGAETLPVQTAEMHADYRREHNIVEVAPAGPPPEVTDWAQFEV